MDDETLGRRIVTASFPNIVHTWTKRELTAFGCAARELLAKPVATREGVLDWLVEQQNNSGAWGMHGPPQEWVDMVFSALSHFAPPRQRMMIEGMSVEDITKRISDTAPARFLHTWGKDEVIAVDAEHAARVAHRLATTPAPEVDADAGAKALAWKFHKAALVEIGAENADDLWASFKDHQRLGWRAVAAMEKGNG